jgi:uncharacterized protein YbjT (DUF2867 family)
MLATRFRTAVIAGATGLVGRYCLEALLGRYDRVTALTRRRISLDNPKLLQQVLSLEELESTTLHANDVFTSLGAHPDEVGWEAFTKAEFEYPRRLAEHAARAGARQFIFVSVPDSMHSENYRKYTSMKRQLEGIVAGLGFAAVHVMRPSLLLGVRERPRADEQRLETMMRWSKWMMIGGLRKYRPISAREVGHAMVAAALKAVPGVHIYYHDQIRALASSIHGTVHEDQK